MSASAMLRFLRDECAATSAEFALVVPFFIVVIFSTINGAIMLGAINQLHYSAERAARCLSVDVGGACTVGGIDAYAKGFYNGPSLTGLAFTASTPTCGNRVVGTGTFQLVSGLEMTNVPMSATACYPKI